MNWEIGIDIYTLLMCEYAKSLRSRLRLCNAMDYNPSGSSVHGDSPGKKIYWSGLPCPPPQDLPNPGTEPMSLASPALAGKFFTTSTAEEALHTIDLSLLFSHSVMSNPL